MCLANENYLKEGIEKNILLEFDLLSGYIFHFMLCLKTAAIYVIGLGDFRTWLDKIPNTGATLVGRNVPSLVNTPYMKKVNKTNFMKS